MNVLKTESVFGVGVTDSPEIVLQSPKCNTIIALSTHYTPYHMQ